MRCFIVLVLLATTAAAEPTLELRIEGDLVKARVTGAAKVEPLELYAPYKEGLRHFAARSVRGFYEEQVAIAFVANTQEQWLGTSEGNHEYDPYAQTDYFTPLAQALERLSLGTQLPAGSEAMLVTYSTGAEIKAPWAPVDRLSGSWLGSAVDYRGKVGMDLVAGVRLAYEELARRPQRSKLMVIIGDGNDTNNGSAIGALADLTDQYPDVVVVAVHVRTAVSPEGHILDSLTLDVVRAGPVETEAALKEAIQIAGERFEASFDLAPFAADGKIHRVALMHAGEQLALGNLELPSPPPAPPPSNTWRWLVLAGVIAAFCLLSFATFRKK